MATPHTPGPWRVLEVIPSDRAMWTKAHEGHDAIESQTDRAPSIGIRSTTRHMQDVYGSCEGGHLAELPIAYDGREQALANAHLIAAAPELLEVATEAIACIASYRHGGGALDADADRILARLGAVIAKAEGGQP
jgi:hypothetical protein